MKPKRETAEQRARRIGRGLGFYLMRGPDFWTEYRDGELFAEWGPRSAAAALWRALARARGVRT